MKAFLNASEAAKLLNIDRATVIRWIKKGTIKVVSFTIFKGGTGKTTSSM